MKLMKHFKKILCCTILATSLSLVAPVQNLTLNNSQTTCSAETKKETQVYITRTGKKYHKKKCGNGTYYKTSLSKAKKQGLTKCKKCY